MAEVMEQSARRDNTTACDFNQHNKQSSNESSDEDAPRKLKKKHVHRLSDSDSEQEKNEIENKLQNALKSDSDSDSSLINKSVPRRSRIQLNNDSDSDENVPTAKSKIQFNNDSDSDVPQSELAIKNSEQQLRFKNKKDKIREKFKGLLSSRGKEETKEAKSDSDVSSNESHDSEEEMSSIENIKKKIQERMSTFKSSICDPDTSDEESHQQRLIPKQKKERKRAKLTSPKPQRMSAKQAMENMQKIKSESNRMLREKEVSLPYHRPKAVSLKDIMSRRQPAVTSDGKTLPIKMNEKQLQQYAQMLEERQKKMMELWQSESSDDDDKDDTESTEKEPSKDPVTTENPEQNETDKISVFDTNNDIQLQDSKTDANEVTIDIDVNCLPNVNTSGLPKDNNEAKNSNDVPKEGDESCNMDTEEQDSETNLTLKYNDSETSITEDKINESTEENVSNVGSENHIEKPLENTEDISHNDESSTVNDQELLETEVTHDINTENQDTGAIHLHFDSEQTINLNFDEIVNNFQEKVTAESNTVEAAVLNNEEGTGNNEVERMEVDDFSDNELNMDDIDKMIENAEIIRDIEDKLNTPVLMRDIPLNVKPKLTGTPGMVIDLEDRQPGTPKMSGVELLKERFNFFAKLKTPEEMERERENKIKPGTLHLKLKQDLEDQIAEQRSLEWAKRLEDEKQQQQELKALRGEESDEDNDLEKIEAKLETNEPDVNEESNAEEGSECEEELIEDDCDMTEKPKVKNAMVDDEAEESDCDEVDNNVDDGENDGETVSQDNVDDNDQDDDESEESSSSESEEDEPTTKKGRILKAFEDSDEEELNNKVIEDDKKEVESASHKVQDTADSAANAETVREILPASQDDEVIQLAQRQQSASDDLFTSQESSLAPSQTKDKNPEIACSGDVDLGTQTFSILESSKSNFESNDPNALDDGIPCTNDDLLESALPGDFTQAALPLQIPTQVSQSQPIGEDILALCTGKFYDNEFVSQSDIQQVPVTQDGFKSQIGATQDDYNSQVSTTQDDFNYNSQLNLEKSQEIQRTLTTDVNDVITTLPEETNVESIPKETVDKTKMVDDNLKSILDELADPEFDSPKPNKFFVGGKKKEADVTEGQVKKRLIIDSDDENNENLEQKKRKKLKKRKPEKRALQFSDDEDEEQQEEEYYESDIENEEDPERLVEYDSEENEIEIKPDQPKKKRKATEFFEQEAELTSEDEWVGSGDENEAGLDRMEREAGDDEVFHQGKLQRELGQIHMRDVLDQDKREVRMIQELLFEDGDLGGGGRQRKFRWKNLEGDEETGTLPEDLVESQEDQESEEQWRKQRHEREMFLRQMQNKEEEDHNISVNRTTIIKANLSSKTMSSLLLEVQSKTETSKAETSVVVEKKTTKDIPSPKKPFALLQQSYQGSLLNRGRGALARLAALATPLAVDDDAPKSGVLGPSNRRNFVFAAISQDDQPKVTKRKAEENPATPKLVKKMKREDKQNTSKNSLLDYIKI